MNITELSNILGNFGEFVGAIGVVITLIYLSVQVKHGKEATEANTRQMEENRKLHLVENYLRRSESVERAYKEMALSDALSKMVVKGEIQGFDSLDALELYKMTNWSWAHMHRLDAQFYQYQQGLLDDEAYVNMRRALKKYAPMWQAMGVTIPRPSFQKEIDDITNEDEPSA
ncbi:hypothetical protein OAC87_00625 [Pseudomonadales bacterium]|nr:hypothetical protein [Pseudomonadales bacterium]